MSDCLLDDDDDEILSNFPMTFDDEEEYEKEYEKEMENIAGENDYDSTDEVLTMLMDKENAESPLRSKSSTTLQMDIGDNASEEDDDDDVNDDSAAQIAALQAQIKLLQSASKKKSNKKTAKPDRELCKHKEKTNDKGLHKHKEKIKELDEYKEQANDTELCKHKKMIDQCFFCQELRKEKPKLLKEKPNTNHKEDSPENRHSVNKNKDTKILCPTDSSTTSFSDKKTISPVQKKERVAHESKIKSELHDNQEVEKKKSFYKEKKLQEESVKRKPIIPQNKNLYTYAGISISNPKMGSTVLEERMKGRKLIKISKIQSTMKNNDIEGDWVTLAVLVKKCVQKKATNGKNFSVWQLSDLCVGSENQTVGFFLFGDTYKEHWKLQVGTVIGLLNPTIMKQDKDSYYQELSITLDNSKKLMEIGVATELGVCKGIRKSDGKNCTMFINKRYGDYCEYHLQKAFKKARSGRMELQSGGAGPDRKTKGSRMQAIRKDITSGEVHYGGKTMKLTDNTKNNVKLSSQKQQSGGGMKSVMSKDMRKQAEQDVLDIKMKRESDKLLQGGSEEFKQLLVAPTVGSRNLIHMLHGDQEKEELAKAPKQDNHSAKRFLKQNKNELLLSKTTQESNLKSGKRKLSDVNFFNDQSIKSNDTISKKSKNTDVNTSNGVKVSQNNVVCHIKQTKAKQGLPSLPKLGRGLAKCSEIEFSDDEDNLSYNKYTGEDMETSRDSLNNNNINKVAEEIQNKQKIHKESVASIKAKRKAISLIQLKGKIAADDPNEVVGRKKAPKTIEKIQEKLKDTEQRDSNEDEQTKKRKGLLAGVLGNLDLNSEEGKKLLKQKSRNVGAVLLAESEREEKYFDGLEKKERMEEKLTSIYEIKVKCVACKQCGYMAESRSQLCRDEQHAVAELKNVTKRFFKCKSCNYRTFVYNKLLPTKPCKKCGAANYEKTTMATERKGPKLGSETLELRGREQKFLNSLY